jgi:hypothetical protein
MKRWLMIAVAVVTALTVVAVGRIAVDRRTADVSSPRGNATAPGHPRHQPSASPRPAPSGQPGQPGTTAPAQPPVPDVDPDSFFTPTRLRPGERPPQFVVVSFDGAGSHDKWAYWRSVADRAGMRFTGFLSGVYLVDQAHATAYRGPGHRPGASSVGFADDAAAVGTLVGDLNEAWRRGYEIGTHYNGHFCGGTAHPVGEWTRAEWNAELDQFFTFYRDYRTINGLPATSPDLLPPAASVKGGRTPCLEGRQDQLFGALRDHGMTYDSSGNTNGIRWPRQVDGIWEFPMGYVPLAGTTSGVIAMDYNFYYKQHQARSADAATAARDSQQVLETYRGMFAAAYDGNRAPLVLGNHFNSWNHDAYTTALATFVLEVCHRPDVRCVPYRDVIRWMQAQDPAVLARLQALPPVDTVT